MSDVHDEATYSAYATQANGRLGGSRFVRRVEIRTDGESVWLRGRRTPAWLIYLRPLGWIWSIVWESVVEFKVPIGRKGRMKRLTLTTPTNQRATLVQVLSGLEVPASR